MLALRSQSSTIVNMADEGFTASPSVVLELKTAAEALNVPTLIVTAGASDVPEGQRFTDALAAFAARYGGAEFHVISDARHYIW